MEGQSLDKFRLDELTIICFAGRLIGAVIGASCDFVIHQNGRLKVHDRFKSRLY